MPNQSIGRTVPMLSVFGLLSCLALGCNTATHGPEHPEAGNSNHGYWNDTEHWVRGEPAAPQATQTEPAHAQAPKATPAAARTAPAPEAAAPVNANAGRLIIPTGDMATSVLLVEKSLPGEVITGKPFDYEIKVTNISKNKLEGIVVTEMSSGNLKLADNPNVTMKDGAAVIAVGALNAGESRSYPMNATAASGEAIKSCVSATYSTMMCLTSPIVSPALRIVQTIPADFLVCEAVPVRIVVTNTGTGAARGVRVQETLPAGMTVDGKNALGYDVGVLPAGQSREIAFNAKVAKSGRYDSKAVARAEGEITADSGVVSTVAKQPVLAIDVKGPPEKMRVGGTATYEITVTNKGDAAAPDATLQMPTVSGLTFASATEGGAVSGSTVAWHLGAIAPGQSRTVSVTGKGGNAGMIKTNFSATAKCADAVSAASTVEIVGAADIGTSIHDDNGVVSVGATHTFTYVVRNQGQIDLTNVSCEFSPDPGLEFVSTNAAGGAANAGGKQTVNVGTVKPGEEKRIDMIYKGAKEGDLILQGVTTSDQTRAVRNDEQVNYVK